jgi:hypothetical protein
MSELASDSCFTQKERFLSYIMARTYDERTSAKTDLSAI